MNKAVTNIEPTDPVALTRQLIECRSVTPTEGGALDILEQVLSGLGFLCQRLPFSAKDTPTVDNLYARLGNASPNLCFAGHTDVVPEGDRDGWRHDPFAAVIEDGLLYGRGATDMKGAIAAFIAAVARAKATNPKALKGSISLMITGDEEGPAVNGTVKILNWLKEKGEVIDHCLVGEPTNPEELGQMIKIGRRGSVNMWLTVKGAQGHVAYPQLAKSPVPALLSLLSDLTSRVLDQGTEYFQPSNLEITSIDIGNQATNVIPAEARVQLNIRFNTEHTGAELVEWVTQRCAHHGKENELHIDIETAISGEAFLNPPDAFQELIKSSIKRVIGREPEFSTSGGTSDARFIKDFCPVAEFGLISQTMHKIDERVSVRDIEQLSEIYNHILQGYFTP